jgi:hypothetical protein
MSGRPNFPVSRDWVQPSLSQKSNGNGLRSQSSLHGDESDEQQSNIKLAGLFALVALLFVLAEHLGRIPDHTDTTLGPDSTALVSVTVSRPERSGTGARLPVRFRLSNRGNHSIFYPVNISTNTPIVQLVARATVASDWVSLSSTSAPRLPAIQEYNDTNLRWIEMPPGGWTDGEFSDSGDWTGEHACAIFLKPSRNAGAVRILSEPFGYGRK